MEHGSVIAINLGAIDHNIRSVGHIIGPDCGVCAVVKANAYGLGAIRIARQLVASGVDMLAVFEPAEAVELFDAGLGVPVLVLMPVWEIARTHDIYRALVRGAVHLTVHSPRHLEQLVRIAEQYASPMQLHVELDTGMRRGGCSAADAAIVLRRIASHRLLHLAGIFTHFARARDSIETTEFQRSQFEQFISENSDLIPPATRLHMANTAATLRDVRYHRNLVRIGLAWAGFGSELFADGIASAPGDLLHPSVCWTSRIVLTRQIERGMTVGYGGGWTASRPTRLGLVPVGYADGFPMGLRGTDENGCPARIAVQRGDGGDWAYVPVVGALSMDQITVDLTDAPDVGEGCAVELFGGDRSAPNYLPALARAAGVIPHSLLAGLSPLIPRRYDTALPVVETVTRQAAANAGDGLAAAVRGR